MASTVYLLQAEMLLQNQKSKSGNFKPAKYTTNDVVAIQR